jgi:hypothetical protein
MAIKGQYRSESGRIYERHDDGWRCGKRKLSKAVFLSSQGAAVQYDMLKNGMMTSAEFFEKDDEATKGYLYYVTKKGGKTTIKHSSKLTKILEDTLRLKDFKKN